MSVNATVSRASLYFIKSNSDSPAILYTYPEEAQEVYWLTVEDDEGIIFDIDLDFNLVWRGDKERAKKALRAVSAKGKMSWSIGGTDA
jgi:spore coat protein CotH